MTIERLQEKIEALEQRYMDVVEHGGYHCGEAVNIDRQIIALNARLEMMLNQRKINSQ